MKKVLILTLGLVFLLGCNGVPKQLKMGSELLAQSYDSLEKDYQAAKIELDKLLGLVQDKEAYVKAEKKFTEGFKAVGIAVKAMNGAIQALGDKD